jgi:hypothetical protein
MHPESFQLNVLQVSFIVAYLWAIGLYVYSLVLHRRTRPLSPLSKDHLSDPDIESKAHQALETTALVNGEKGSNGSSRPTGILQDFWTTPLVR